MLGQRAESMLNCGIKLILDFLIFGKISILWKAEKLCLDNFESVLLCKVEK